MTLSRAQQFQAEGRLYRRTAFILVGFAVFGFGVVALLGLNNSATMPLATIVHSAIMIMWTALFACQAYLGTGGGLALHRRLGWLGAGLASVAVPVGLWAATSTIASGRVPPIFAPGYFLVLGWLQISLFGLFIAAAITLRKRTDWHRRLMIGSFICIFEPVLGRVLPFAMLPFLGSPDALLAFIAESRGTLEMIRIGVHVAIVLGVMALDWRISGAVHRAWWWVLGAVALIYTSVNTLGMTAAMEQLALRIAG